MSGNKNEGLKLETRDDREQLSRAATAIATRYMNLTQISGRVMADKLGISSPSFTFMMRWGTKEKEEKRKELWSFDCIIALSKIIGIKLSELIALCEAWERGESVSLTMLLNKYKPCSKERLECIVRFISFYDARYEEETGIKFEGIIDMGELAWKCAEFVHCYTKGDLSDADAYTILSEVDPFLVLQDDPYAVINESFRKFKSGALKAR